MVWPFTSKEKKEDLGLDKNTQSYYDSVIEKVNQDENKNTDDEHSRSVSPPIRSFSSSTSGQRTKPLKQVAMDNCVEFENAYSKCLVHGSYFERVASCQPQLTMYEQCKNMQIDALEMLGYSKALDDQERKSIKMLADDLMIKAAPSLTITEAQVDAFNRLVQDSIPKN